MRSIVVGLAVTIGVAVNAAQSPQPAFDVVSVKENTSVTDRGGPGSTPGRFRVTNSPLRFILLDAFHVMDHQLIGAPEWTESVRYDITATYPANVARSEDDTRAMLRALLADRFGLRIHRETRELPIYSLVMARKDGALGPQLVRSSIDCEQWLADKRPQMGAGTASPVAPGGKRPVCMILTTRRFITAGTRTMSDLLGPLQAMTGRPVVDRTGLTGAFDFDLQWTSGPLSAPGGNAASPDDGPSIFVALQEQLGLRLESGRAPFEVVVVDAVRRPTPD
jgi:uncharacterized protein (TIGR03435 family)